MDNQTKLLLSKASLEMNYQSGQSAFSAYKDVNNLIEYAYQNAKITRREMSELKQLNEEIYLEFSGGK